MMARYVDIEDNENIIKAMYELFHDCNFKHKEGCMAPDCKECIKRLFAEQYSHLLPTADVVEVKHGRWDNDTCTICKLPWNYLMRLNGDDDGYFDPMPPFCPNCGAKMDGKTQKESMQ